MSVVEDAAESRSDAGGAPGSAGGAADSEAAEGGRGAERRAAGAGFAHAASRTGRGVLQAALGETPGEGQTSETLEVGPRLTRMSSLKQIKQTYGKICGPLWSSMVLSFLFYF